MQPKVYDYIKTASYGKQATQLVIEFLKKRGCVIDNVEDDTHYRTKGIDIRAREPGKNWVSIEVKADRFYFKTPNYVIEDISNKELNNKGWICYSQARYLYYVFLGDNNEYAYLHIIPMQALKEWILSRLDTLPSTSTCTSVGQSSYTTCFKLVPRYIIWENIKNCRFYDLIHNKSISGCHNL